MERRVGKDTDLSALRDVGPPIGVIDIGTRPIVDAVDGTGQVGAVLEAVLGPGPMATLRAYLHFDLGRGAWASLATISRYTATNGTCYRTPVQVSQDRAELDRWGLFIVKARDYGTAQARDDHDACVWFALKPRWRLPAPAVQDLVELRRLSHKVKEVALASAMLAQRELEVSDGC